MNKLKKRDLFSILLIALAIFFLFMFPFIAKEIEEAFKLWQIR